MLTLGDKLIAGSFKTGASWEVGDVGISALGIDETQNKRRYLNGQVISQAQFVEFTAMLKSRVSVYPNLATTEVNWQAEVTNSDLGQCGKFVIDDDAGTIRLPKVVNINGLQNLSVLGGIKAESLPNITGGVAVGDSWCKDDSTLTSSALYSGDNDSTASTGSGKYGVNTKIYIDASLSSSTYQDDAPVQQEAVQYPYFIQVAEGVETSVDVSREIELNNPFSLLDYKYSEYELSNASWLLSNGQWNSGAVYQSVYNLLLQIYNGTVTKAGVSVKLSTETYADTDFVLNTSDTTFRLPIKVKLPNSKGVAGNGMALGMTNGVNNYGMEGQSGNLFGYTVAYGKPVSSSVLGTAEIIGVIGATEDAAKSGLEVKDDSSIYLYFYVGETVQDANIIAAAGVLTDVADLKNASNFSSLGKETIVGWVMPDYSAGVSVTSVTTSTPYTATKNGFLFGTTYYCVVYVNGSQVGHSDDTTYAYNLSIPLSKGDIVTITGAGSFGRCNFYPCKGVN